MLRAQWIWPILAAVCLAGAAAADHRGYLYYTAIYTDALAPELVMSCGDPRDFQYDHASPECQEAFEPCESRGHFPEDWSSEDAADEYRSNLQSCYRADVERFQRAFLALQNLRVSLITDPRALELSAQDTLPLEVAGHIGQWCGWDTAEGRDWLAFNQCARSRWHEHLYGFAKVVLSERDALK